MENIMKTKVWVITHKKYNEIKDKNDLYNTLHVGRALSEDLGYCGDDTGDNISDKNKSYCELTGMYWLWKNIKCDIIGICHYRRFFLENDIFLTKEYIENVLENYDCIVPKAGLVGNNINVREYYEEKHYVSDLDVCRQIISIKYPDYVEAFDIMQQSSLMNFCNMLITRKEVYDSYCKWLFDILFEAEKLIDISYRDDYQKRVMGFLSERLFKVWLIKNGYKVKEQTVKMMESDEIDRHFEEIALKKKLFNKIALPVIERYNSDRLPVLEKTIYQDRIEKNGESVLKTPVWMCWWQGEDNAPELVRRCIQSVSDKLDYSRYELHIITLDNCQEYVTFSPQIIDKFNEGKISFTTLSDRLRMELLYRYGGLWIDSTYFVQDGRINELDRYDFYTQKTNEVRWDDDVVHGRWACNFLKGEPGYRLFGFVMEAFDEYYKYMDSSIEYFTLDYFICIAYDNLEDVRRMIDECPINNKDFYFINDNPKNLYNEAIWNDVIKNTFIFKLSYKIDYSEENIIGEKTYYGNLMKYV